MRFDCAPYMAAYFSQNMVPLRSNALVNLYVFWADLRLEFGGKTIAARHQNGARDHQNCILIRPSS